MNPRPSKGEYPNDWPEIALRVKCKAEWRCVRCKRAHNPRTGRVLTVHHLDNDRSNCRWWNIPALCQRCHLSIQARVVMERPWLFEHSDWFRPYAAGYYAHTAGFRDDRNYVLEHIEELLKRG